MKSAIESPVSAQSTLKAPACEPIAITGMSCRFPGAPSLREFWSLLSEGRDGIGPVPAQRWDADVIFDKDPKAPGKTNSRHGGFIDNIDRFDAAFFGISPREATQMDPQQRILLEIAYEAIEDAGLAPTALAGSDTAVFVGAMTNDYFRLQTGDAYRRMDVHTGSGAGLCMLANRLSYQFDLRGPSVTVDTACSSSLVAVFQACQSLWTQQSRLALAAGVSVILDPAFNVFYAKAGLSAPDARCKTFSAAANGIGRGEGAAVIVLKRLADAVADGDPIYAVIRGGAVNHDGRSNGLTQPNRWAQEQLLRQAFAHAAVDPRELQYIELHGTGTLIGDPIEANALGAVLTAGGEPRARCLVGSVKTNLGHLEAAAGIAGLVKLALSMAHGAIPPSLWFDAPNPHIDFERIPLRVNTQLSPWLPPDGPRLGGVSSFGLGGANAHIVLQSAPTPAAHRAKRSAVPAQHCLLLSARSLSALKALARAYLEFLPGAPEAELPTICATALRRKAVHDFRVSIFGRDVHSLVAALQAFAAGVAHEAAVYGRHRPSHQRIVLAVPEQAHVDPQAWASYLAASSVARESWDACRAAFFERGNVQLPAADELWRSARVTADQPDFRAWHFSTQYTLLKQAIAGVPAVETIFADGLGQLAALCAAGAISLDDAVCWLEAGLSEEFPLSQELPEPRYGIACDFDAGRQPALTAIQWRAPQRPWHARVRELADVATIDLIVLDVNEAQPDPELASAVGKLIVPGTETDGLQRLFAQLALRHQLNWSAWADGDGFVRLPSYPWQRESYWLVRNESPTAASARAGVASQTAAASAGQSRHALLGTRPDASATVWESRLSTAVHPYLPDHRVQGLMVLPGAAYAELGLALQHQLNGQAWGALEALEFHQALVIDEGSSPTLRVTYDQGTREYAVYSQVQSGGKADLHARGKLSSAPPAAAAAVRIDEIQKRCTQLIDGDTHYTSMQARGLQYGPYFQGVQRSWLNAAGNEVLAWIALREQLSLDEASRLHPALFDASLQTLLSPVAARGDTQLYVPVGMRQLQLYRKPAGNGFWCHGKLTPAPHGVVEGDVILFDESGQVIAAAYGVRARALTAAKESDELADIDRWLYQFAWQPAALAAGSARRGRWLVFMDRGDVGEQLVDRLTAADAGEVLQVWPADSYTQLSPTRFGVRPQSKADLLRVVEQTASAPVDGVIYLWGLDVPDEGADLVGPSSPIITAAQLLQALDGGKAATPLPLVVVTRQAQSIQGDVAAEGVTQAPLVGLVRVAVNEYAGLRLHAIDIDRDTRTLPYLVREILSDSVEDEIALRADKRYVRRLLRKRVGELQSASTQSGALRGFTANGTYLITGGFGGFALQIAAWMVDAGARNLALVGRRGADTPEAAAAVDRLRERGARVLAIAADVSSAADVDRLFLQLAQQMPPLKGIFHAAAVLEDSPIQQLDEARIERVLRPKALGAWHLHQRTLALELDHFVLFSSLAAMVGNPGQAAYVAASSYLDALARHRRERGLPAVSINWGALGEVGMAARNASLTHYLSRSGVGLFTPTQAVQLLGRILELNPVELGAAIMDWQAFAEMNAGFAASPKYGALIVNEVRTESRSADQVQRAQLLELGMEARRDAILPVLTALLAATLELEPEEIEPDVSMLRMGIDSLMAMDLQSAVEKKYGVKISTLELMKGNNLMQLALHVAASMGAASPAAPAKARPAATAQSQPRATRPEEHLEDVEKLMGRLGELTEDEMDQLIETLATDQEVE